MKKFYIFSLWLGGMLGSVQAQSPVKISKDSETAYRIAAEGSTVIWYSKKSGTQSVYVSKNGQKVTDPSRVTTDDISKVIASSQLAGFATTTIKYRFLATGNGTDFYNTFVDTNMVSPYLGADLHENKVFTFEPTTNANFKIHERNGVNGAGTEITDKARLVTHSKGNLAWAQTDFMIKFRNAAGVVKTVNQVQEVKGLFAYGNKTAWIKDGSPASLQLVIDGENQVKITDVGSVNDKAYFLGDDKIITIDVNAVLSVFTISGTPQKIRSYPGFIVLKSRNGGVILSDANSKYYTLNTDGDTISISGIPGFSAFSYMDISGENLCVTIRPTAFVSVLKWYKNGVFQKDITSETTGGAINDEGFYVSETSAAWSQNSFSNPALTGVYLYEFSGNTGVAEAAGKIRRVEVYPNPVHQSFRIDAEDVQSFEIYDMRGALQQAGSYADDVNVAELEAGVYIVKLQKENGEKAYSRFIKE